MADSVRKLIMTEIGTRLALITAAPYRTTIGNNVFEWKSKEWSESGSDEMPGVAYMDISNTIADQNMRGNGTGRGGTFQNTLRVEFAIAMKAASVGGTNSEVMDSLRDAIADVYEAINVDHTWGGNAQWTSAVSDDMGIDQDNRTIAGANIKIDIIFRTLAFQPSVKG